MKKYFLSFLFCLFSASSLLAFSGITATLTYPEGSGGSVQYNDDGYFGGEVGFQYDETSNVLSVYKATMTELEVYSGTFSFIVGDGSGLTNLSTGTLLTPTTVYNLINSTDTAIRAILSAVATDTTTLKDRTDSLDTSTANLTIRLNNLDTSTATLTILIDGLQLFRATASVKLDALEVDTTTLRNDLNLLVTNVQTSTAALTIRVDNLDTSTGTLQSNIDGVYTNVASTYTTLIAAINSTNTALTSDIATATGNVTNEYVSAINSTHTALTNDIATATGNVTNEYTTAINSSYTTLNTAINSTFTGVTDNYISAINSTHTELTDNYIAAINSTNTTLQSNIDDVYINIVATHAALTDAVNSTNTYLQGQIDGIVTTMSVYDEGVFQGNISSINVTGNGASMTVVGGTGTLNVTASGGGGGSIGVYEESTFKVAATSIAFSGDASVTFENSIATITITSDGLAVSATAQVSSDFMVEHDTITLNLYFNTDYAEIAMSEDGQYIIMGESGNNPFKQSSNYGQTWTTAPVGNHDFLSYEMSGNGQYRLAGANNVGWIFSNDYGVTYSTLPVPFNWSQGMGMSWDGKYLLFHYGNTNTAVMLSSDYGVSFTTVAQFTGKQPYTSEVSETGQYMIIGSGGTTENWVSNDYGVNWTTNASLGGIGRDVEVSGNGQYMGIYRYQWGVYISSDYGVNFTGYNMTSYNNTPETGCLEVDRTGQYWLLNTNSQTYYSEDYGVTWNNLWTGDNITGMSKDASKVLIAYPRGQDNLLESGLVQYDGGGNLILDAEQGGTASSRLDVVDGSVTIRANNANVMGMSIRNKTGASVFEVTNNGFVGIGIDDPQYILSVDGEPGANGYTQFTNYSDKRLKKNEVKVSTPMITKIALLDPIEYEYNDDYYDKSGFKKKQGKRKGFNAQDLKDVFPDMVGTKRMKKIIASTGTYEVDHGTYTTTEPWYTTENENYYTTNLSNLQIYLTKALQELFDMFCEEFPSHDNCSE